MSQSEWSLKPEFEFLHHAKLTWAKCSECKRGSYWVKLPTECKNCGGKVKRPERKTAVEQEAN